MALNCSMTSFIPSSGVDVRHRFGLGGRRIDAQSGHDEPTPHQHQRLADLQLRQSLGDAWRQVVEIDLFHGLPIIATPRQA